MFAIDQSVPFEAASANSSLEAALEELERGPPLPATPAPLPRPAFKRLVLAYAIRVLPRLLRSLPSGLSASIGSRHHPARRRIIAIALRLALRKVPTTGPGVLSDRQRRDLLERIWADERVRARLQRALDAHLQALRNEGGDPERSHPKKQRRNKIQAGLLKTRAVIRKVDRAQQGRDKRQASFAARQRLRSLAANVFLGVSTGKALDTRSLALRHPSVPPSDLARLRNAFARFAADRFVSEFIRIVGDAKGGALDQVAINAAAAAAVADAAERYKLVDPAAIPALADAVNKAFAPVLPTALKLAIVAASLASRAVPGRQGEDAAEQWRMAT